MDMELLKTFLEVRQTRHFANAARNLFVTQAAVSARIRALEVVVGQKLFTRNRNNIKLTSAGHQLVPYAESILGAWDRALLETAFRDADQSLVVLGCLPSLREIYLDGWLIALMRESHDWLLQLESLNTQEIVNRLRDGSIDLGIVYEPPRATDLWVEALTSFDLVLVATEPSLDLGQELRSYLYVDWGSSFAVAHDSRLAGIAVPQLKVDTPILARQLLLQHGGSAYLADPMISAELDAGRLFRVADAPVITRNVYLIGTRGLESETPIAHLSAALQARAAG